MIELVYTHDACFGANASYDEVVLWLLFIAAASDADLAQALCQKGSRAAFALAWKEALVAFEEGVRAYTALPLTDETRSLAWDCAVQWGAAASEAKQAPLATTAYGAALAIDEKHPFNERKFSPKVRSELQAVLLALSRAGRAGLTLTGSPDGAEVWVDGRASGRLPMSLAGLLPGTHTFLVRAADYEAVVFTLTLPAHDVRRHEIYLKRVNELVRVEPATSDAPVAGPRSEGRAQPAPASSVPATATSQPALALPSLADTSSVGASASRSGRMHPGLAWLPFGIPQFMQARPVAGSLFLVSQVALLATNLVLYGLARADKQPDGGYAHPDRSRVLQLVVNISFGVLIADFIGGAIDGELNR